MIDFDAVYPGKKKVLFNQWGLLYKSIVRLGKQKQCPVINKILEDHAKSSIPDVSLECKLSFTTLLIP